MIGSDVELSLHAFSVLYKNIFDRCSRSCVATYRCDTACLIGDHDKTEYAAYSFLLSSQLLSLPLLLSLLPTVLP